LKRPVLPIYDDQLYTVDDEAGDEETGDEETGDEETGDALD
jgi:hypothetical protein